jgi:hypothetical protein
VLGPREVLWVLQPEEPGGLELPPLGARHLPA